MVTGSFENEDFHMHLRPVSCLPVSDETLPLLSVLRNFSFHPTLNGHLAHSPATGLAVLWGTP